jgi:hypothetical protein
MPPATPHHHYILSEHSSPAGVKFRGGYLLPYHPPAPNVALDHAYQTCRSSALPGWLA